MPREKSRTSEAANPKTVRADQSQDSSSLTRSEAKRAQNQAGLFEAEPVPVGQLAEAAMLGAMLCSAEAARGAAEHLAPDHFQREAHRVVFEAVAALVADDRPVDPVTLTVRLAEDGRLDHVGGAVAVFNLSTIEVCPNPAAWKYYARCVSDEANRRRQICDHVDALRTLGVDVEVTP